MEPSVRRFRIRWSRLTWVVTVGACSIMALIVAGAVQEALFVPPHGGLGRVLPIVVTLVLLGSFGIVALFVPVSFEVRSDGIVVKRIGWDVVISRGEIRGIRRVEPEEARFAWRLFGSGGLFGWFGLFYNGRLGDFWAYAGNREDLVLLTRTNGEKIVVSPYPPDAFIAAVQEAWQPKS